MPKWLVAIVASTITLILTLALASSQDGQTILYLPYLPKTSAADPPSATDERVSALETRVARIESALSQPLLPATPAPAPTPSGTGTPTPAPAPRPTPTITPTPSASPTPTATPTPALDYVVISRVYADFPNERDQNDTVRGRVIDLDNNLVPGLRFRISRCCPDWSAESPREWEPASDGTFEFSLAVAGNYTLQVLSGRAETVRELHTDGFRGTRIWEVVFQKVTVGAPPPPVLLTPTPTVVRTATPTPTGVSTATTTPTVVGNWTSTPTPTPTLTLTPTPVVFPTPTETLTPTPTSTAIVRNIWRSGPRPPAGGGYIRPVSFETEVESIPELKGGSAPATAFGPVSSILNLEEPAFPEQALRFDPAALPVKACRETGVNCYHLWPFVKSSG